MSTFKKLDDILNKFNNAHHDTTKINSAEVKPSTYIRILI